MKHKGFWDRWTVRVCCVLMVIAAAQESWMVWRVEQIRRALGDSVPLRPGLLFTQVFPLLLSGFALGVMAMAVAARYGERRTGEKIPEPWKDAGR
jgi:hypothetical protein